MKPINLKIGSPNFMQDAIKVIGKLGKNPTIRGSEAFRALKATINANKGLGKTISSDVKQTIVQSITALAAGRAVEESQKQQTNREVSKNNSSFVQNQLNSLFDTMYNRGENGQGQNGSTTDINNKGSGSKGDG